MCKYTEHFTKKSKSFEISETNVISKIGLEFLMKKIRVVIHLVGWTQTKIAFKYKIFGITRQ